MLKMEQALTIPMKDLVTEVHQATHIHLLHLHHPMHSINTGGHLVASEDLDLMVSVAHLALHPLPVLMDLMDPTAAEVVAVGAVVSGLPITNTHHMDPATDPLPTNTPMAKKREENHLMDMGMDTAHLTVIPMVQDDMDDEEDGEDEAVGEDMEDHAVHLHSAVLELEDSTYLLCSIR